MAMYAPSSQTAVRDIRRVISPQPLDPGVALLTGGFDKPYVFGLAMELTAKGMCLDVIGSDDVDTPEMHSTPGLQFLNLQRGYTKDMSRLRKVKGVVAYYARLIRYAASSDARIFHILWNNKFQLLDRTLLMGYYKALGKKIVFTAHNVNAGKRDSNDSWLNRATLKSQYRTADHIFVHTQKNKVELIEEFGVGERAVTVIPFGINNSLPNTELTSAEAKSQLSIGNGKKTILFFGNIGPYKGLEFLVAAFQKIAARNAEYRLIIAGKLRGGSERYWSDIREKMSEDASSDRIIQKIEYIPDEETELYFKAADVLVLPYTEVSQSGVLFLGYNFGLPVVASDVGSLRDDIVEGTTGFLCKPSDADDLARAIQKYFASDVYKQLGQRRRGIRDYAEERHSWNIVGEMTRTVYTELLQRKQ